MTQVSLLVFPKIDPAPHMLIFYHLCGMAAMRHVPAFCPLEDLWRQVSQEGGLAWRGVELGRMSWTRYGDLPL